MKELIAKCKDLNERRPHFFSALFFILGFAFDLFTIDTVDDLFTLLLQVLYLVLLLLLLISELTGDKWEKLPGIFQKARPYQTEIFHFFLGALLSAYTIFYFKSASLAVSFVFIFLMTSLLILNEVPYIKSRGPFVKVALLTLCSISFFLCLLPVLTGTMGPLIFVAALILGPVPLLLVMYVVYQKEKKRDLTRQLLLPTFFITIAFLVLYILRLIPPVPLSLKYVGVYHQVERVEGSYRLSTLRPWWRFWHKGDQLFRSRDGDKVYIFARVFAPGGFQGQVVVHWQYYEQAQGWMTTDRIPLTIGGGRTEGYRGFTYKSSIRPGSWRVMIETPQRFEIGRISFDIEEDQKTSERMYSYETH